MPAAYGGLLVQFCKRLGEQHLQLFGGADPLHSDAGIGEPLAKDLLPILMAGVRQVTSRQRQDRVLIE